MDKEVTFKEKIIDGLTIVYKEATIDVYEAVSPLSNFGNIEKLIYPILPKYTDSPYKHRAILDLRIEINSIMLLSK